MEDFLDFQAYIEALAADGLPAAAMNTGGTIVPSSTNQVELTGFLQQAVRKMEGPLILGRTYGTQYSIKLVAEHMVEVKFKVYGDTDRDAPYGFSTSLTLPL